jgi:putative membrane protein
MKHAHSLCASLALLCILPACSLSERVMPGTMSDANVIAVMNTIDKSEMEAAQLAKQKAQSSEVRNYANHLIADHSAIMDKNRQLSSQTSLRPDPPALASTMNSTHQETMDQLRKLSGPDFDRAYMEYQVKMHEEAVSLVEKTSSSADNPQLRQQLGQVVHDLRDHLTKAKSIQSQIGARS